MGPARNSELCDRTSELDVSKDKDPELTAHALLEIDTSHASVDFDDGGASLGIDGLLDLGFHDQHDLT